MGYYTEFSFELIDIRTGKHIDMTPETFQRIKKASHEVLGDGADYALSIIAGEHSSAKWYDWQKDVALISSALPDLTIELWGSGESDDDKWICWFHAGEVRERGVQMIYPEYDPSWFLLEGSQDDQL